MLTREEWDAIQEMRPRTPFESKLARPNARIRTGDPIHLVMLASLFFHLSRIASLKSKIMPLVLQLFWFYAYVIRGHPLSPVSAT